MKLLTPPSPVEWPSGRSGPDAKARVADLLALLRRQGEDRREVEFGDLGDLLDQGGGTYD
jgi:hypothetical protein